MIVVVPSATEVTSPVDETVATLGVVEAHVTGASGMTVPPASLTVAVSVAVSAIDTKASELGDSSMDPEDGEIVTEADPLAEPEVAVMVVDPSATAVTSPADETVAIDVFEDVHVTVAPEITVPPVSLTVALSVTVSPTDDKLLVLGASAVIDSSKEDFVSAVHERFGKPRMRRGGGVDAVINFIGGDSWASALRCIAPGGRMLTCGATAGFSPPTDIRYIWTYEQTIIGSNGWMPTDQVKLLDLVARGDLFPEIHAVRPLEETAASIQELADRRVVGKVVIAV